MTAFSAIDFARLPPVQIIDQPDFPTLFEQRKARLLELAAGVLTADRVADLAAALALESEPLTILLQEDAYREMLLRAAVQDAGKGNLLAYASGAMLDHLGAFYGVKRQIVQEADPGASPPLPEIKEDDERLRARIQFAPEGFTTAGPVGAYMFWALAASPLVKDVSMDAPRFVRHEVDAGVAAQLPPGAIVLTVDHDAGLADPFPGDVAVTVLSNEGDGTPDAELLQAVDEETQPRRPLTDRARVRGASVLEYQIEAVLTLYEGPDGEAVRAASEAAAIAYAERHHRLGHDITVAGLHAALVNENVQNVDLISPAADIVIGPAEAAFCTDVTVTVGGRDV